MEGGREGEREGDKEYDVSHMRQGECDISHIPVQQTNM